MRSYPDWNAERRVFHHPFERDEFVDGFRLAEWWLKLKRGQQPYDYSCFVTPSLCEYKKSPRFLDGAIFDDRVQHLFEDDEKEKNLVTLADAEGQYPYAYHFDANLLAAFLKEYAIARGVTQIVDDVMDAVLTENGSIDCLATKAHGLLRGDLYIDCTGFRGLLINQALGEPFISYADSLLCDSAIAMRVPTAIQRTGINPYTTATALSAGWVWNIPLYGRDGAGYVYASAFLGKEEAEREFRQHIGSAAAQCDSFHIKMRVGRNRNSWVKNCVVTR